MKVLFVIHTPKDPLTAVYASTVRKADYLIEEGNQAQIWGTEDFRLLDRVPGRLYPLLYPLLIAWRLLRRGRHYDVVVFHSYSGWLFNCLRRLFPSLKQLRVITSFHGLEPIYFDRLRRHMADIGRPLSWRYQFLQGHLTPILIRLSCRRSDMVVCLNRQEVDYLVHRGWALPSHITIAANSVEREFFTPMRVRNEGRRLLFVGQWLEMKGIRYLVDAFSRLAPAIPSLELWCVGTQARTEAVLSDFPEELRTRVFVRPRATRDEIITIVQQADIFVFPSLSEGSSNALLEAMAAGLPIVTTAVGAAPDMLESGIHALFVPERDGDALVNATQRLIGDKALRERLGRHARTKAEEYDPYRVQLQYLNSLMSLTGVAIE